jgi:hypothetical protein
MDRAAAPQRAKRRKIDVRSLRRRQAPAAFLEIVGTQRYPCVPAERFQFAKDRNLQGAANEEILLINDTDIGFQEASAVSSFGRDSVEI